MVRFKSIGAALLPLLMAACTGGSAAPAEDVQAAITEDIQSKSDTLTLTDPRTGAPLALTFDHVHEGVEETPGGRYVACVDYRTADGAVYDVDYYVDHEGESYRVQDVVLHKAGDETVITEQERAELETRAGAARGNEVLPKSHSRSLDGSASNSRVRRAAARGALIGTHVDGRLARTSALGPDGTVYVADAYNHRIQRFSPDGAVVVTWGGPPPSQRVFQGAVELGAPARLIAFATMPGLRIEGRISGPALASAG